MSEVKPTVYKVHNGYHAVHITERWCVSADTEEEAIAKFHLWVEKRKEIDARPYVWEKKG
jgi:hypothetical protein